ncbi:MAG: hypothetical protein H8D94_01295 [Candidatus Pelagibacter sp.]|nr:hypothetical protein [Candidatus Pelagibacter sp.]
MPTIQAIEQALTNKLKTDIAITVVEIQEVVNHMRVFGMSENDIVSTLSQDLINQGRLFGSFRNRIKNTVKNAVTMAAAAAQLDLYQKANIKEFRWVTVSDTRVCPDCIIRHNRKETLETFKLIGLPQSGFSVCRDRCRCLLVPMSYSGENLDKPLLRPRNQSKKT